MIKNYVPSNYETVITYGLCFDDGYNNGFEFPCDSNGNLLDGLTDAAIKNYNWCLKHPEKFQRFNTVVKNEQRILNFAYGTCDCGEEVHLYDEYYGACECPNCGKWYNLFGQELVPPKYWDEDMEDDF